MPRCSCGVVPGDCYDACGARESKISDLIRERDALAGLLREWLAGEYDGQDYLRRVRLALHQGAPVAALKGSA